MDWKEKYGITVVPIMTGAVAYSIGDEGVKFASDDTEEFSETIWLKEFALKFEDSGGVDNLRTFQENIEKIYLLDIINKTYTFNMYLFTGELKFFSEKGMNNLYSSDVDAELKQAIIGKKIYFLNRTSWETNSSYSFDTLKKERSIYARFNFIVLDKAI